MEIKPDRNNWRQFCQEPELTAEEWADWRRAGTEIVVDDDLYDFVDKITQVEWAAKQEAESTRAAGGGWAGLVAEADARRRLMRAELKAWRRYHAEKAAASSGV